MKQEFIIIDNTIKYNNPKDPLDERMKFCGDNNWSRRLEQAIKYADVNIAIQAARELALQGAVRVLVLQYNGNAINVGEVNY